MILNKRDFDIKKVKTYYMGFRQHLLGWSDIRRWWSVY